MKKAFTLIELLLVLLLLGVFAGIGAAGYGGAYRGIALQKTADDVAFLMRYAQSQAVSRRQVYRLDFSADKSSYRLSRSSTDAGDEPADFANIPERIGRPVKVPTGVTVQPEQDEMMFFTDGTMDKNRVTVSNGHRSLVVSSYEQRGYVVVVDPEKKS